MAGRHRSSLAAHRAIGIVALLTPWVVNAVVSCGIGRKRPTFASRCTPSYESVRRPDPRRGHSIRLAGIGIGLWHEPIDVDERRLAEPCSAFPFGSARARTSEETRA